jgi:hypothetical protein
MVGKIWIYVIAILTLRGAVSGGVVAFVLQVLKKFFNWEPGKRLWVWAFLVFGFIISAFLAWQDEYDKAHPQLTLAVGQIAVSQDVQIPDGQTMRNFKIVVIVPASISNTGPLRSGAENYALEVLVPGKSKPLPATWLELSAKTDAINVRGQEIPASQFLDKETLAPIESGDKKKGILFFAVEDREGLAVQDLLPGGTKFTLSCIDVGSNTIISPPHVLTSLIKTP